MHRLAGSAVHRINEGQVANIARVQGEFNASLSVIGSFSYLSGDKNYNFDDESVYLDEKDKAKLWTLMAGPAWRVNDYISFYGLVGFSYLKASENVSWVESSERFSSEESWNGNGFAYGVGLQINPAANFVIDIGYEGSRIKDKFGSYNNNGFNIGVGYRF